MSLITVPRLISVQTGLALLAWSIAIATAAALEGFPQSPRFVMRRLFPVFIALLLAVPALAAGPGILIFNSAEAPGKVSSERIAACFRLMAQDLKLDSHEMPSVVVLHVSRREGLAAGVDHTLVRRNYEASNEQTLYYEFWIVGEPRAVDYTAAAMNILENRMGRQLEQKEKIAIMQRTLRYLQSTVSAYGE